MTIYYEEEGSVTLSLPCRELAEKVAEAVLSAENCPYEAEFSLLLTENEQIRQINRDFREIDRPTDVLSFPMVSYGVPGDFSTVLTEPDCFNPQTGELMLGDIVVSKEKVLKQAEAYGHSVKREFSFLIAHSVLHLLGYDHMDGEERQIMEKKQDDILKAIDILR